HLSAPPTYAASSYTPPPAQKPERSCTSCQASLAAGAIFCSRCGSKVMEPIVDAVTGSPTCPQCGLMNQSGSRFCSGCGQKF
ncbi:MAG: zinc ribbon domain-containing protein, partial [Blastocatellia bacterium]|nr:zinc ribbon domain-containing protein [Blastocatellia bacterium]